MKPANQVAVFNVNGYLAVLAARGKKDEKDVSEALQQIEKLVADTFKRRMGFSTANARLRISRGNRSADCGWLISGN